MNRKTRAFALAGTLALFLTLAAMVAQTEAWQQVGAGGAEDMDALLIALFKDHVLSLEVLGVALTAALIGALIIARPLRQEAQATEAPVPAAEAPTQPPSQSPGARTGAAAAAAVPAAALDTEDEEE